jgi:hypothetical protein
MTLHPTITAPVKAWVTAHPSTVCHGQDRVQLEQAVRVASQAQGENYTAKQIKTLVHNQLRVCRPVICPQNTRKDAIRRAVGAPTGMSPIEMAKSNVINNPINAANISAETLARNTAYVLSHPNLAQHHLTDDAIKLEVTRLWEATPIATLGGLTLKAAFESGQSAIYIGITKQLLEKEDTRWITERGALNGGKNRPVLRHPGGNVLQRKFLVRQCGMKSGFIHSSHLRLNEAKIEAGLQKLAQRFTLGVRLYRRPAMGPTILYSKPADMDALTFVFITAFPITRRANARTNIMRIGTGAGQPVRIHP